MITAEQIQVESVGSQDNLHFYEALVDDQAIAAVTIDVDDVPIQVFSYMAQDGFFAESMIEAMQGLASLHNEAL